MSDQLQFKNPIMKYKIFQTSEDLEKWQQENYVQISNIFLIAPDHILKGFGVSREIKGLTGYVFVIYYDKAEVDEVEKMKSIRIKSEEEENRRKYFAGQRESIESAIKAQLDDDKPWEE